jgi:hypothetical protein
MTATTWVAIWGASISTSLAALQFLTWFRAKPRLRVECQLQFATALETDQGDTRGTVIPVAHGRDLLNEEVLIALRVINHGERALQIAAVVVESLAAEYVHTSEITPDPLPTILDPLTSIEVTIQKEFIDLASAILFVGVVDALGRRYPVL